MRKIMESEFNMDINNFSKRLKGFIPFILLLLMASCALPTISGFEVEDTGVAEIFRSTSTVTLNWSYDPASETESYNIYYRAHGDSQWIFLENIPATAVPAFEVSNSMIGDGSWNFGVSSLDISGMESEIHSSLDVEADPETGWYLLWAK